LKNYYCVFLLISALTLARGYRKPSGLCEKNSWHYRLVVMITKNPVLFFKALVTVLSILNHLSRSNRTFFVSLFFFMFVSVLISRHVRTLYKTSKPSHWMSILHPCLCVRKYFSGGSKDFERGEDRVEIPPSPKKPAIFSFKSLILLTPVRKFWVKKGGGGGWVGQEPCPPLNPPLYSFTPNVSCTVQVVEYVEKKIKIWSDSNAFYVSQYLNGVFLFPKKKFKQISRSYRIEQNRIE
jgi:hypothetical protein